MEIEQFIGFGFFTLALINAGLAQGKNRSGFNWFFVSLFLGPVATFVLVVFCEKKEFENEHPPMPRK